MDLSKDDFKDPFGGSTEETNDQNNANEQIVEKKLDEQNEVLEDIVANTNPEFMDVIPSTQQLADARLFLRNEDAFFSVKR